VLVYPHLRHHELASRGASPTQRDRYASVKASCGELCETALAGEPGRFFPTVQRAVDCNALFENRDVDAPRESERAPEGVPNEWLSDYTMQGRVALYRYGRGILDNRYLGTTAMSSQWSQTLIDDWIDQARRGVLRGTYGVEETNILMQSLHDAGVQGMKRALVIGSEIPWVEALCLAAGIEHVTTLEYGAIVSEHPSVATMTPDTFRQAQLQGKLEPFDAIVTYSSVEHAGLGRYGDALNPFGDLIAIARGWCVAKPGAVLVIGVMYGKDAVEFNAHRVYGPVRYPYLATNWGQVARSPGGDQRVHVFRKLPGLSKNGLQGPRIAVAAIMGGLGNQLFIVAAALVYAHQVGDGMTVVIEDHTETYSGMPAVGRERFIDTSFWKIPQVPRNYLPSSMDIVTEHNFNTASSRHVSLGAPSSYFHDPTALIPIRGILQKLFTPPPQVVREAAQFAATIARPAICMQLRFPDSFISDEHVSVTRTDATFLTQTASAVRQLAEKTQPRSVLVHTNDDLKATRFLRRMVTELPAFGFASDWATVGKPGAFKTQIHVIDGSEVHEPVAMELMAHQCDAYVATISTFQWWGMFLNPKPIEQLDIVSPSSLRDIVEPLAMPGLLDGENYADKLLKPLGVVWVQ